MRTIDLSPLHRFAVGFDRVQRQFDHLAQADARSGQQAAYPPYNIEATSEDAYRITMAVAGFAQADLDITSQDGALIVSAKQPETDTPQKFLHRGIATRAFERRFELADHIKVVGANLENGLLHIELAREVPEALKPQKIAINQGAVEGSMEQAA